MNRMAADGVVDHFVEMVRHKPGFGRYRLGNHADVAHVDDIRTTFVRPRLMALVHGNRPGVEAVFDRELGDDSSTHDPRLLHIGRAFWGDVCVMSHRLSNGNPFVSARIGDTREEIESLIRSMSMALMNPGAGERSMLSHLQLDRSINGPLDGVEVGDEVFHHFAADENHRGLEFAFRDIHNSHVHGTYCYEKPRDGGRIVVRRVREGKGKDREIQTNSMDTQEKRKLDERLARMPGLVSQWAQRAIHFMPHRV